MCGIDDLSGLALYDYLHATEGLEVIPTLFMSANMPLEELSKRGVPLIDKPFELEDLLQAVEKLLAE